MILRTPDSSTRRAPALCFAAIVYAVTVAAAPARAQAPALETVATLDVAPGNVTVTPDGAVIVSLHQFFSPRLRVARIRDDGTLEAFPNAAWNAEDADRANRLDSVLGLQCDPRGVVWMLDNGMRGGLTPKLVGWNTRTDRLHRVVHLPVPVTRDGSFVNDLAVDLVHEAIYIADPAGGANAALIVVDLATGAARRVLEGHVGVTPENVDLTVDGAPLEMKGPDGRTVRPRIGVNPIALDAANDTLVFGPMSGTRLYRVPTAALRDAALSADDLAARVESYGDRPICDGVAMDVAGNVYITDVGHHAIGVTDARGRYRVLVSDPERLSWPDALSFGPDGMVYAVSNQLHRSPALNGGVNAARPPFVVTRFRPLAPGVTGR